MVEIEESPGAAEPSGIEAADPDARGRSVLIISLGLGLLIVGCVTIILLTAEREVGPPMFPPVTPEGTVQRYVQALEDRDNETAYSYFSHAIQEDLSERDFTERSSLTAPLAGFGFPGAERRVGLLGVDLRGDRATVTLEIEEYFEGGFGPFGPGEYSYERPIRVALEDGEWKIDQALYGLESTQDPFFQDPFVQP
ncbi:MAG: hypothetical protein M3301_07200 [Chloroflexota bacterium]|nr:hypothetical protein [Chloroflexota bacterium]